MRTTIWSPRKSKSPLSHADRIVQEIGSLSWRPAFDLVVAAWCLLSDCALMISDFVTQDDLDWAVRHGTRAHAPNLHFITRVAVRLERTLVMNNPIHPRDTVIRLPTCQSCSWTTLVDGLSEVLYHDKGHSGLKREFPVRGQKSVNECHKVLL